MNRVITYAAILLTCLPIFSETTSTIEPRPDGLWLVFSNTPPRWRLEQTADLFTWYPVLDGYTTNSIIEFKIKSGMEAIFFRVIPHPSPDSLRWLN